MTSWVGTLPRTLTRVYCPMLLSFVVSANVFRENRIRNPTTKNISLLCFIIPPSLTLFCAHPLLDGVVFFFFNKVLNPIFGDTECATQFIHEIIQVCTRDPVEVVKCIVELGIAGICVVARKIVF